jgi:hypothetical protein
VLFRAHGPDALEAALVQSLVQSPDVCQPGAERVLGNARDASLTQLGLAAHAWMRAARTAQGAGNLPAVA